MLLNDLAALGNRLPHAASHTLARVLGLQHVWSMFCEECDAPDPWEAADLLDDLVALPSLASGGAVIEGEIEKP